jgi:hypothetical protein
VSFGYNDGVKVQVGYNKSANKKQTMANKPYLKHKKSAASQRLTTLNLFFV